MNSRRERAAFVVIASLAFIYVVLRAVLVPLIHDEARTFQLYVITGRFLPFASHWDAGNHLLSTALGWMSFTLFGPEPFPLRLFSVLSFPLYAWYVWRMCTLVSDRLIRWCCLLALLCTPFLIEFFALFRGYGPSIAYLMVALFRLPRYLREGRWQDLLVALLGILLATYASLTLMILWCAMLAILAAFIPRHTRTGGRLAAWTMWLILGLVPLVVAAKYSMELNNRDLLYYGNNEGILSGTIPSLCTWILGVEHPLLTALICSLMVALTWLAARDVLARTLTLRNTALIVLVILLLGEVAGRVVLGEAFNVLYPADRTAMHVVPMFILALGFGLDHAAGVSSKWSWAAMLMLWFPVRTLLGANVDRTSYWPEQAIPKEVFAIVEEKQRMSERPLLVGGYRQNPAVWAYGNFLRGNNLNFLDVIGFPQPTCDLMVIDTGFFKTPAGFRTLFSAPHGKGSLLERERSLHTALHLDTTCIRTRTTDEFIELWVPVTASLRDREWLIEVDATVTSPASPLEAKLVVDATDDVGGHLHYDIVSLEDQHQKWKGDRLLVLRRLPVFAEMPQRVVVYLWNPERQPLALEPVRLIVYEVLP